MLKKYRTLNKEDRKAAASKFNQKIAKKFLGNKPKNVEKKSVSKDLRIFSSKSHYIKYLQEVGFGKHLTSDEKLVYDWDKLADNDLVLIEKTGLYMVDDEASRKLLENFEKNI